MSAPRLRAISLGAGVQSTTLALMAAAGEIGPMPDCAIFADTGWEPRAVYEHLGRLEKALPFPVHRVSAGNIREDAVNGSSKRAGRFAAVPWFLRHPDGSRGLGTRQCTTHYKLDPIRRKVVELLGGKRPKAGCEMWIGISTDEAFRVKPSRVQYIVNRWPLIELRRNRSDCTALLTRMRWAAPKSSCIGCPFRSDEQWRALDADEFADAVVVDRAIRQQSGTKGEQFMHQRLAPLESVDLRTNAELGQPDLFLNECEGMCGV
jgi:hypothetical protein